MLEMRYAIKPDEHGVYNGAELAASLIADALRLLAPYVNGEYVRVESLFRLLAADEFEKFKRSTPSADIGAFLPTVAMTEVKRATAIQAHLAANRLAVELLLKGNT